MEQSCGAQIRLGVPPVARAGCATARTQYALVHPIEFSPILLALRYLLTRNRGRVLPLQPGFNTLVLIVEIGHIHNEILDDEHMRQRSNRGLRACRNLGQASQAIAAINIHGAGAADSLPAGPAESEGGIDLVLDFNQGVEDHGPTLPEIDLILLKLRLGRILGVPSVDLEGLEGSGVACGGLHPLGLSFGGVGTSPQQLGRRRR